MTRFHPIKTQAQIDAEEDRRALIEAAYEYGQSMIGLACLVAIVFVPLTMGG